MQALVIKELAKKNLNGSKRIVRFFNIFVKIILKLGFYMVLMNKKYYDDFRHFNSYISTVYICYLFIYFLNNCSI